jgi:hypothetical protein
MTDKRWALAWRWAGILGLIGIAVDVIWLPGRPWSVLVGEWVLCEFIGAVLGLVLALRLELRRKVRESVMIDGEWVHL